MPYRLFQYTLPAPDLDDLNAYLGSHRVATVAQYLAPTSGGGGMLVFVVETAGTGPASASSGPAAGPKIDYREQLSAGEFAIFGRLREERKKWAEAEGLPVYAVFTNAQLAAMAKGPITTISDLARIDGLGAARLERYSARLLALLAAPPTPAGEPAA